MAPSITTRNTFIELVFEDAGPSAKTPPRSASAPPSLGARRQEAVLKEEEEEDTSCASTVEGWGDERDTDSSHAEQASGDERDAESSPGTETPEPLTESRDGFAPRSEYPNPGLSAIVQVPAAPRCGTEKRTSLKSGARAFTPGAALAASACQAAPRSEPPRFGSDLVVAVTATLRDLLFVKGVDVAMNAEGWSVSARMHPRDSHMWEPTLTLVEESLANAADASGNAFMVGAPMPTSAGFAAYFDGVLDERVACWSMLQRGHCHFGSRCRWEHSVPRTSITVNLVCTEQI